ncbi:TOMM biosynthesis dehydrogenase protein B [Minicystis rosea]|nr:TOMM biosynthesis dehydrogenase protein B [Minicystis rosea]
MESETTPSLAYALAFQDGLTLAEADGGDLELCAAGQRIPLRRAAPGLRAALEALASGGVTASDLGALVSRHDGGAGLPSLFFYLERFEQRGLLTFTASWEGQAIATLVPAATRRPARPEAPVAGARYGISRFALLRCDAGRFVLESPLGFGRVVLHDGRAAALCHALSTPRTLEEAGRAVPELPSPALEQLAGLMLGIGALSREGSQSDALATWSAPDLWFHTRSRQGRHDAPYGATYPWRHIDPSPALKAPMEGETIPLFRPDIDALATSDPPFTRVLEARRSHRRWGARPIRVAELGEWLYRAARVRAVLERTAERPYDATNRPYAGGGACYPLELYLAVDTCDGLAPGLYHHHALEHTLTRLSGRTPELDMLLARARGAMRAASVPQVLVVVAARVQRTMWKYESMAYAAILKDTGSLYQTLYLVATAMGLAPCALGGGDAELFAAASGLDPLVEPSVGEIVIGTRAEGVSPGE